jgi:hypothetical protein
VSPSQSVLSRVVDVAWLNSCLDTTGFHEVALPVVPATLATVLRAFIAQTWAGGKLGVVFAATLGRGEGHLVSGSAGSGAGSAADDDQLDCGGGGIGVPQLPSACAVAPGPPGAVSPGIEATAPTPLAAAVGADAGTAEDDLFGLFASAPTSQRPDVATSAFDLAAAAVGRGLLGGTAISSDSAVCWRVRVEVRTDSGAVLAPLASCFESWFEEFAHGLKLVRHFSAQDCSCA